MTRLEQARIIQIHPGLRCNLACSHCYSSSGPGERTRLDVPVLNQFLRDAADEGYDTLAISGGEPLLYTDLPQVIATAHDAGLRVTLTTNGMPLIPRRVAWLTGIDLVAVSLDGPPAAHNASRGSASAFSAMKRGVARLRDAGIPFGFLFMLTQHNVCDLEWVAEFAVAEGAGLLQVHPLELAGRGADRLDEPDSLEVKWALAEVLRMQARFGRRLALHLDAVATSCVGWMDVSSRSLHGPLSDVVEPLVLEADGTVVPMEHGFPRTFALGNVHDGRLPELAAAWREHRGADWLAIHGRVAENCAAANTTLVNWPYQLAAAAV